MFTSSETRERVGAAEATATCVSQVNNRKDCGLLTNPFNNAECPQKLPEGADFGAEIYPDDSTQITALGSAFAVECALVAANPLLRLCASKRSCYGSVYFLLLPVLAKSSLEIVSLFTCLLSQSRGRARQSQLLSRKVVREVRSRSSGCKNVSVKRELREDR